MNIFQASSILIFALVAFVSAVASVGLGLWLLHISRQGVARLFAPLLLLLSFIGVAAVALSGRILQANFGGPISDIVLLDVEGKLPVKLMLGFLAGLAVVTLAGRLMQAQKEPTMPVALTASFLAFYAASNMVPAAFGHEPVFFYSLIYMPLILLAICLAVPPNPSATLGLVKAALLLTVITSLLAAFIVPTLALQDSPKALIPGYGLRLWGLTSHANVLGSVALTLCLLEWAAPYHATLAHRLSLLAGAVALVWTQSKTSLAAAAVAIVVIAAYRAIKGIRQLPPRAHTKATKQDFIPLLVLFAGLALVATTLVAVVLGDEIGLSNALAKRLAAFDFGTVQGRTLIWQQAIVEGLNYPLFGYGLNLWGTEYRLATGLTSAFHAHNQFLQVFSVAGVFGTVSFVVYLAVLGRMSFVTARASRGASLALFVVLLVRSIAEVPIQFAVSGELLPHLAFLLMVGTLYRQSRGAQAEAARSSRPKQPFQRAGLAHER